MSDCKGKPIDCVLYRDYDGTCEKDDAPCCLLDGSGRGSRGRGRNQEIEKLNAELAAAREREAKLRALCARQPLVDRIVIDLERMVYYFRKPADECTGDPMQYACEEAEKDLALYAAGRGGVRDGN